MADRSILFSNFNSPEAENPGDFESSYNVNAISKALERQQRDIQRKIDQAREKFEEAKNEQAGRFEQNKELTELLSIDPTQYFSAISADLKKNDKDEFDRLDDLLKNNLEEFVKQATARLNKEKAEIKKALIENQKDNQLTMKALGNSRDAVQKQQDYLGEKPELYSKLYSIQQASKAHEIDRSKPEKKGQYEISSVIIQSDKGELGLAVQMQLMEGSPLFFAIRDGKITFPDKPISEEQMRALLDFLYVHGIKNFELPPTLEPGIKEKFEKAQAAREEEADKKAKENDEKVPYEQQKEEPADNNVVSSEPELPEIQNDPGNEQWLDNADELKPEKAKDKEKKKEGYAKALDEMETWLQKSLGKEKNLSYFRRERNDRLRDFVSLKGWTVYSVYPSRNPDNYKLDGKRKDGVPNETYSFRIMIKPNGKGGIDVGYAMPKGGKVTDQVADKVVALQKSQGNKYIRFPKGLSDDDTGVFRMACARAGVIPRGIGINEHHAKKMIDAASGTLSEKDLEIFKYRLALQMEANMGADTNGRQANKVAELKGEYFFSPFKDRFDDTLKPALQDAINGKEADKVIGASRAIQEIYGLYEKASEAQVGDLVNLMQPEDQKAFLDSMTKAGITMDPEMDVRAMPKEYMSKMFAVLSEKHAKNAAKEMESEFARRRETDPDAKSYDVTKEMVADETANLRQMGDNLEKDHHVPGLRVPYLGSPRHDYPNDNSYQKKNTKNNFKDPRKEGHTY